MAHPYHQRRTANRRRGAAVVEFAVCIPVLVLLVFGTIESSSYIFLKQSLTSAAYESAREAARDDGTNQSAQAIAQSILNSRNVQQFNIQFPNGEASNLERGDEIVVSVTAPAGPNSPLLGEWVPSRQLQARITMLRE